MWEKPDEVPSFESKQKGGTGKAVSLPAKKVMPVRSSDLHGNVPDSSGAALLLIDVVNDFEFEGGDELLRLALPVGKAIARLKKTAKQAGIPAIYVNDNFGKWQSDLNKIVSHCTGAGVRGKPFVELLLPDEDDYFVLKPKHSGFFSTTLDLFSSTLESHADPGWHRRQQLRLVHS